MSNSTIASNGKQKPFIVKESVGVNFVAGLVFVAMTVTAFLYNDLKGFEYLGLLITLIPGVYFFVKTFNKTIILEINEKGIFFHGKLLTNWENFISANYDQKDVLLSLQDNFYLQVDYIKPGTGMQYTSKINLPNTLNKAEEDIIAAIKVFCPNAAK